MVTWECWRRKCLYETKPAVVYVADEIVDEEIEFATSRKNAQNIVVNASVSLGASENTKTNFECFQIYVCVPMIAIAIWTNIKIASVKQKYTRVGNTKFTYECETRAVLGILYIADVPKEGKRTANHWSARWNWSWCHPLHEEPCYV